MQLDQLFLSLPIIVVLLTVLCRILVLLRWDAPKNRVEMIVADGSIGLYLGWIVIATVANTTAVLVAFGIDGSGIRPELWAVLVLAAAAMIGIALALWDGGRLAPTISLCWGICWVAIARLIDQPFSPTTAIAAITAAAAIIAATAFARIRQRARRGRSNGAVDTRTRHPSFD